MVSVTPDRHTPPGSPSCIDVPNRTNCDLSRFGANLFENPVSFRPLGDGGKTPTHHSIYRLLRDAPLVRPDLD